MPTKTSASPTAGGAERHDGRIVTFYSYKGGTGRTMMLANLAWVLASHGRRVLVIDWDLEAPGLHRYLHPFLVDPELRSTEGLIDLVTDYATRAVTPTSSSASKRGDAWYQDLADLTRYAFSVDYDHFPDGATLDVVTAGRQGAAYAARVNSFDWSAFYQRLGGGAFLEALRRSVRDRYDYVLIDSRTGVSDTSGICTVQLPDTLVVCFTLNRQSIEGAAAVAESVRQQRPDLRVLPIPSRVELGEKERLDRAREYAYNRFASLLTGTSAAERDDYWGSTEVLYQPFYAYQEVLAPFADRPRQPAYLLAAVERLADRITDGDVTHSVPPPEDVRVRVLARYLGRDDAATVPAEAAEAALLREELKQYEADAAATAEQLATARRRNRRLAGLGTGVVVLAAGAVVTSVLVSDGGGSAEPEVQADVSELQFGDVVVGESPTKTLGVTLDAAASGTGFSILDGDVFEVASNDCSAGSPAARTPCSSLRPMSGRSAPCWK